MTVPDPKPRAVGVVFRRDKLALIRRRKNGRTYYVFPGGKLKAGERPRKGVAREVREETGLRAEIVCKLFRKSVFGRMEHWFLMSTEDKQLRLGGPEALRNRPSNHYEPIWVRWDELPELDPMPPGIWERLVELIEPGA